MLGTGVSDLYGEARVALDAPLRAGQRILALNRTKNSVGLEEVVQALPTPTGTATSPAPPTGTAPPRLLGAPPDEPARFVPLLPLLLGGLWLGRRLHLRGRRPRP
jgi:hypothetical protein